MQANLANKPIQLRGAYGYNTAAASDDATIDGELYGESMTIQAHAEDADINVLMKRYGITGQMPDNAPDLVPMYGDFTDVTDYRSAVEAVQRAHEAFMLFPAELRARFDNDPQRLLAFAEDKANLEEMRKFGLAKPIQGEPPLSRDTQAIVDALKPKADPPKSNPST